MPANIQIQKTGAGGWDLCRDFYPLLIWSVGHRGTVYRG
jgi:hypothetical protein